jgi:hypothetical protein
LIESPIPVELVYHTILRRTAMSTNQLYHTWLQRIRQFRPHERVTRLRNFAWLLTGIYQSHSVHLSKIAGKIPGPAKLVSLTRRLSRFLDNPAIRVREWYEPVVRCLLVWVVQTGGEIRLIADSTKVGFSHQLLIVTLAFHGRAIPLAWTWVQCAKGHSSASKQLALLAYVHGLIPAGTTVLLIGDSEFGAVEVLQQLDTWCWKYVLRQKANHLVQLTGASDWQRFGDLIQRPGQSLWCGRGLLTGKFAYSVNLLAHWAVGEDAPWLLATNLLSKQDTLRAYRRRMWVDEMFGDWKGHGFDLESTHLIHFQRLSRLTLAVAFLYVWLVAMGSYAIKNGDRHLVDRKERRDLSVFQIGWRIIERRLSNSLAILIPLCPCL